MSEKSDELVKLKKSVMGLLSRREYSRLELQQKMQLKGYDSLLINSVLDDFQKRNWQSDERFTEMFIRNRMLKNHGPLKIKMELKARGIDEIIVNLYLNKIDNWSEVALTALHKKYTHTEKSSDIFQKQYRFLQQRGFSSEQIRAAIAEIK